MFVQHKQLSHISISNVFCGQWMFVACARACVCVCLCVRACVEKVNSQITTQSKVILIAIYCVCYFGRNMFAFVCVHVNTLLIDVRPSLKNNIIITTPINVHIKMLSLRFLLSSLSTKWWKSKLLFRIRQSKKRRSRRDSIFALIAKFNKVTHLISFNASFCSSFPLCLRMCGMSVGTVCISIGSTIDYWFPVIWRTIKPSARFYGFMALERAHQNIPIEFCTTNTEWNRNEEMCSMEDNHISNDTHTYTYITL